MAIHTNKKLSSTILILSILFFSTFASASVPCAPTKKPHPIKPSPIKPPPVYPSCPKDTLKLGACVDVLGLVNVVLGGNPYAKCCTLIEGLTDLEAAACLCTVVKVNALGIKLKVPITLSVLVNACGKNLPSGYKCA
ncbi:14 kDa proline-rich protein DC2.15-like [Impatiens glandulifera]|uniref:14 kDa proline-rich protein DC2.15-like n=1 Tax=Impatiens glandulifera TaxID=253017 RepID=UPI001FB12B08|nr:14 kDa proline-rich protein DC2.15-like [Impatiens glandulifera]